MAMHVEDLLWEYGRCESRAVWIHLEGVRRGITPHVSLTAGAVLCAASDWTHFRLSAVESCALRAQGGSAFSGWP